MALIGTCDKCGNDDVPQERLFVYRNEVWCADCLVYAVDCAAKYFEHCRRVSVSARHKSCSSAEMQIRMSLKKDAERALENQTY
jgi:hypothetical protein